MPRPAPLPISAAGLEHVYPDGTVALRGIGFTVPAGGRLAVVGGNGAGKSTLLLRLNGTLLGPGEIRVGEVAVARPRLREVRRRVGLLFQDPDDQLFCPTVGEDVAFGPRRLGWPAPAVEERVQAALAAVGLAGQRDRPPHNLSLGEKRRAALAAVLAMGPPVLALDEPLAGLDPAGRRRFLDLLDGLASTMIVVTHDLELARRVSEQVVVLRRGEVVACGPPAKVLGQERELRDWDLA